MRRRTLLTAAGVGGLGAAAVPAAAQADYSTTVNPATDWGAWEGWGTSLCWWGKAFGNRNDLADIMFTRNTVALGGTSLPGLGMNIVRYNAGACSWNSIGGESMAVSPNMMPSRQMEGYWLDWNSSDPASSSWNWNVDSAQRNLMWKARDRGANLFELFSNSPMWWMCANHNPAGGADGNADNLQSWNRQQHAVYMATVAKYAHDNWGVDFDYVDPFNEPIANWWTAAGTQEGCHFNVATQSIVIDHLRTELNARGLSSMPITASDESLYDQAVSTWNGLTSSAKSKVAKVNVHGYQYEGGRRDSVYSAVRAAGKTLWNSEYGESDGSGLRLARNLNLDFRWLHPTAWCYWQVLDGGGWGLIQADNETGTLGAVNPKYYVYAQYARHIRPGMRIIDGGEGNTIAAYDAAARKLVLVTTNYGTAQTITYDLAAFGTVPNQTATRWSTQTNGSELYRSHSDTAVSGKRFSRAFPANTVQTFEINNVVR
ncbi:glycoside hydrolase [Glycomyces harbinensis]|uniref:Galactan endo-1,6-beta-galactosidase n=1 Tax=Glycomyces harbinensis TaxID=58114 RepID=A0A1G7AET2_9ACTN|nr:glycoside hydrolase [Glycomyces harbinensis]SDE13434.1 galactan endo-1,6-beta-galactosidase [Glycomyces harbinensis]